MRTRESESRSRVGEFLGFVSRRRKAGSLHGSSQMRWFIALFEMKPVAALVDSDRIQLLWPFERQIDPVEECLCAEIGGLRHPWQIASTIRGAANARRERRST